MAVTIRDSKQVCWPSYIDWVESIKASEEDEIQVVEQPKDQNEREAEVTQRYLEYWDLYLHSHKGG